MKKASKFTKEQLLGSKTLGFPVELVEAVLEDGKTYTKDEAKKALEGYQKGKMKTDSKKEGGK
ncbi:hypothetical protein [Chakrabartyella piscis]|uniref:hypothetical protein n=1 Tax=Chakrabartyella piscis TaxID=2918914 RepID=UPI00295848EF|nr:hypothetical protein [Chakrabartyella piscis]